MDDGWYWYKYDEAGNIVTLSGKTAVAEYPYTYRSAGWKDQLVSYNSQAITYDDMGNPLSWKGKGLTWEKGRRLSKISNADGSTLAAFGYDSEGNRVRKTANGVTTQYYLNGGKIVGMKQGNQTVQFVYDPDGAPFLMRVNGVDYYYLFNGQGDVTGLVDKSNNLVVSYVYDSWGKPISKSGSDADGVGALNPLRYRGYVWDAESGLYYLGSRYYDPEVGRFINPDVVDTLSIGYENHSQYNMYVYCFNNYVNMQDDNGSWPKWLKTIEKVAVGVATIAVTAIAAATVIAAAPVIASTVATTAIFYGASSAVVGSLATAANVGCAVVAAGVGVTGINRAIETITGMNCVAKVVGENNYAAIESAVNISAMVIISAPQTVSYPSTGRQKPENLKEQVAMNLVQSGPKCDGKKIIKFLGDPRMPGWMGWQKWETIVKGTDTKIKIHYVGNRFFNFFFDFKFKDK